MTKITKRILDVVDSFQDDLFSFIQRLVQTPSLPGKEQRAQQLLATKLKELGLDVNIVVSNGIIPVDLATAKVVPSLEVK